MHAGVYSTVETTDTLFHFNLNGEILRMKGKGDTWRHPHEWLKRNMGNDWIYYSTGGYTGVFESTGEYYLPNMPYVTNGLLGGNPFELDEVRQLIDTWHSTLKVLARSADLPDRFSSFLAAATRNSGAVLGKKADLLFSICGGRSTVLPPDARHVDYNLIPVTLANGCLYKCSFCEVKNKKPFSARTREDISHQIIRLKEVYGQDITNYNAIFLGEHDALNSGAGAILHALEESHEHFGFSTSYITGCNAFMFGSVSSLLNTPDSFFRELESLPYNLYINIGLESADQQTLDLLGKPVRANAVKECFKKIQEINDSCMKTEVTANFVFDEGLPDNHFPSFLELTRDSLARKKPKGCVYLSPLRFGQPSRAQTFVFNRLKVQSRVPTFLYLIQRL